MSSYFLQPGQASPQAVAELITLVYLGKWEARPWQNFLRHLRLHTDSDVSLLVLKPDPARLYWSAGTDADRNRPGTHPNSERQAHHSTHPFLPLGCASPANIGTTDNPRIESIIAAHGAGMSCYLLRFKSCFGDNERQILQLIAPHLKRY